MPAVLAFLAQLKDPAFLRQCLRLPWFLVKVASVIGTIVLCLALVLIGVAYTQGPKDVQVNCSGVTLSTPLGVRGLDYAKRFGKMFRVLGDGDWTPQDTVLLVRGMADLRHLLWLQFQGEANGDLEHSAVTGYRLQNKDAQEKALKFCCVQLRKFQEDNGDAPKLPDPPAEQPRVLPGPGEDAPFNPKDASFQPAKRFNDDQKDIARVIRQVAVNRGIPARGVLIAYETAFVESEMLNLNWGDRDSLGVFQQRPSTGWGTRSQVRNPQLAADAFFGTARHTSNRGLTDIRGWQSKPMGRVAQAVQGSAFPDRYEKRERDARAMLAAIGGMGATAPQVAAAVSAPVKAPKFDANVPLEAYCRQLDRYDAATGGAPDDGTPRNLGGGPVPTNFDQQGNPRTVEQAIAAIEAAAPGGFRGERVSGRCERYMNLAYGLGGGYATANAHWYAPGPRSTSGVPPRGALVFWRTSNAAGHVALSLGNGIVASTDYNPRTHRFQSGVVGIGPIEDVDRWGPRLGWRAPNFKINSEGGVAA